MFGKDCLIDKSVVIAQNEVKACHAIGHMEKTLRKFIMALSCIYEEVD